MASLDADLSAFEGTVHLIDIGDRVHYDSLYVLQATEPFTYIHMSAGEPVVVSTLACILSIM
jgi:hypothetical protein